jgi:hypothetical protein
MTYRNDWGDGRVVHTKERMPMGLDCESIAPTTTEVPMFDPEIGKATRWRKGQPSPNPGGRPKSRILSEALRNRLAETKPGDPDGRTYAEIVAENLIDIACSDGLSAVHAANEIADRIEGRPRQSIEVSDITAELRSKSDEELRFYLDNCRWPSDEERALLLAPASASTT